MGLNESQYYSVNQGENADYILSMILVILEKDFPMDSRERLTCWMGVQPAQSVDQICSNSGEGLTSWMGVQPAWSVDLICSNSGEGLTHWMGVQPARSVLKQWRATHTLDWCSASPVSGSDLLKQWRATHILDGCSASQVSGSDLLQQWRATHILDGCSEIGRAHV